MRNLGLFFTVLFLFGCSGSDSNPKTCAAAPTSEKAVSKLTEMQKAELNSWKNTTFKKCQLNSVFPSLVEILPASPANETENRVDIKHFLDKTNNSLIIANPSDATEFIMFSNPGLSTAPVYSDALACEQNAHKIQYEAQLSGTRCEVKLDGQIVATAELVHNVPVSLHTSAKKSEVLLQLPSPVGAGQKETNNNYVSLRTSAFVDPVRQVLSTTDITKVTATGVPQVVYPTRERILDLLKMKFDAKDWDQLEARFPSSSLVDTSVAEINETSLGDIAPFSNSYSFLVGPSSFELNKLWDGGFNNQKQFSYSFRWISEVSPVNSGSSPTTTDPKFLAVIVQVELTGNVKDGGNSRVTKLEFNFHDEGSSEESFKKCATKRLHTMTQVHKKTDDQPVPRLEDVLQPCRLHLANQKVAKHILKDKSLKKQFLTTVANSMTKNRMSYDFLGWTYLLREIISELPLNTHEFLVELDPPAPARRVLEPAQATTNFLLSDVLPSKENYQLRLATINSSVQWTLRDFTPKQEELTKLKSVINRLYNDFPQSTTQLIQSYGMLPDDGRDAVEALNYALTLDDDFLKKYRTLRRQAQDVGALSVFTQHEIMFLQRRQKITYLDDWQDILNLASKTTAKAEKARTRHAQKVSDKEFEAARVAIFEISMREGWKPLTFENFERMLVLTQYIPRCQSLTDAISKAACVGTQKFQSTGTGLLLSPRREFNAAVAQQLQNTLPLIDSTLVTEKVALGFYGPLWANCTGTDLEVRKLALDQILDYFIKSGSANPEKLRELDIILKPCH